MSHFLSFIFWKTSGIKDFARLLLFVWPGPPGSLLRLYAEIMIMVNEIQRARFYESGGFNWLFYRNWNFFILIHIYHI